MRTLATGAKVPRSVAALVAGALLTAGCADDPVRPSVSDIAFVATLLPHHHLGMLLVDEATLRAGDVRLRRMVFEMGSYHDRELATLADWADQWQVASAVTFPGEITSPDLERLPTLSGVAHDIWWLHLMIEHHEGAVEIADSALAASGLSEVDRLADDVRRVQSSELEAMHTLLVELCGEAPGDGCPTAAP